jgi:hypothetical protein
MLWPICYMIIIILLQWNMCLDISPKSDEYLNMIPTNYVSSNFFYHPNSVINNIFLLMFNMCLQIRWKSHVEYLISIHIWKVSTNIWKSDGLQIQVTAALPTPDFLPISSILQNQVTRVTDSREIPKLRVDTP